MREPPEGPAGGARLRWHLGVALAAGILLGFLGPFGTYASLPLGWRIAYWSTLILAGTLLFPTFYTLVRSRLEPKGLSAWVYVPFVVLLGALPMCAMVVGVTQALLRVPMTLGPDLYLYVVAIALPMVLIKHMLAHARTPAIGATSGGPVANPAVAAPPAEPRLLDRLPPRLGRDLLCLEMEDHYLRIHTAIGSELILMRLRDAIAELDGADGLQVHRSWWVARRAVVGRRREGKAVTLTLVNGLEVPVARDRVGALKAAGWIPALRGRVAPDMSS